MQTGIAREFRVEAGRHEAALAHGDDVSVARGMRAVERRGPGGAGEVGGGDGRHRGCGEPAEHLDGCCLLYTSDAADE